MSSPAYLPLFPADYLSDTQHLSTEEHGAYLLLLMTAWTQQGCSLPDDDAKLARVCRLSLRKWKLLRPTMEEFWRIEGGRWHNARLTQERIYVDQKSQSNREKARKRWDKQPIENKQSESSRSISRSNAPHPHKREREDKSSLSPRERTSRSPVKNVDLPEWLPLDEWHRWLRYRKQVNRPVTLEGAPGQIATLTKLREEGHDPIAVINQSIDRSWIGLFKLDEENPNERAPAARFTPNRSTADIGREVAARLEQQANSNGSGSPPVSLPRPRSSGWPD